MNPAEAITVITTTSPILSHPSTSIIETSYQSVRKHLPTAQYLFLIDGIRVEQEHLRKPYEEYKGTLTKRMDNGEWPSAHYVAFPEFHHQAGMVRFAIRSHLITTPLVLWVEHDFYFNDLPVDWQGITNTLLDDEACYMRFLIPEEAYLSRTPHKVIPSRYRIPMMRTIQFSGLPHVATTEFYVRLVDGFKEAKAHLECEVTEAIPYAEHKWKLAIYAPPGDGARVATLDGRRGDPKLSAVI